MPNDICPFRFWLAPSAHPHARSRPGPARSPPPPRHTRSTREPQTPERPRPPDCSAGKEGPRDKAAKARREALSGPGSRTQRAAGHAARGAAGPGKSYFSMKPPGPLPRGAGRASEQRVRAPTRPDFRTAAPRERRSGSPSPRVPAALRRAHAAHTRGARPRTLTHTHCTLTVSRAPPLCQETASSPHPARAPPSSPDPSPCSGAQGLAIRGRGSLRPPIPEACPAGIPSTARTPRARPRHEAGRKGRRRDWGWHPGSVTGAPPHPSPPPFSAAQKVADGIAFPVQPTGGSRLRRLRRSWSRGAGDKGGRGAGLRRRAPGRGRQPSQPGTLSSPTALSASYRPA